MNNPRDAGSFDCALRMTLMNRWPRFAPRFWALTWDQESTLGTLGVLSYARFLRVEPAPSEAEGVGIFLRPNDPTRGRIYLLWEERVRRKTAG
jgi:hypothetical protein